MFEQATLTNGPAGERAWTTFLGLTSQVALVSFAVLAPMIWPQVLPSTRFWESLAPPLPPGPRRLGDEVKKRPAKTRVVREAGWSSGLVAPARVPTRVIQLIDDDPPGTEVVGALPGPVGGPETGVIGAWLQNVVSNPVRVAPPPVIEQPVRTTPEPVPAIQRFVLGGNVRLGQLLHKGEPQYPALARAARVSGNVEVECVVGTDGHIHEVKVKSGNPLLVRAAVDAAWQWVYAPSRLNGVPIEIVTIWTCPQN
jgi:protein TonB